MLRKKRPGRWVQFYAVSLLLSWLRMEIHDVLSPNRALYRAFREGELPGQTQIAQHAINLRPPHENYVPALQVVRSQQSAALHLNWSTQAAQYAVYAQDG